MKKISVLINKKEYIYMIIIVIGWLFSVSLMYFRCFYGTEISDEAYYVAEAKEMLNGNIPYAVNDGSIAVGFTFLIIPIIFVCKLISPNLTGVVLVTRLCYATYKLIISYLLYRILKKQIPAYHAMLLSALLIPYTPFSISNFSYNSVPAYAMFLVAIIIFEVVEQDATHEKFKLVIVGVISGIACFANPGYGLALFVLGVLIVSGSRKEERNKRLLSFCVGRQLILRLGAKCF